MANDTENTEAPKKPRGRPRGSVNYRARVARDIMERLQCDPLEALLRMVKNRRLSIDLRLDAAKAAAPYCYPRLATVFMNTRSESYSTVTHQLIEAAHRDPELAAAMESFSLKLNQLPQFPHGAPKVIDVTPALPEPFAPELAEDESQDESQDE